jgi:hypothetical protein
MQDQIPFTEHPGVEQQEKYCQADSSACAATGGVQNKSCEVS